ncbi:MAG: DUF4394 domain-containing protein, partial [Phycisphaerales bacterium]
TLTAVALAATAGAATAQQNWGVISTAGDPDPVTVFDLADPGGSQSTLGFVDGNFNRGMDFISENSFYYFVSTDALNDPGDRGLWLFDNGVNTQLGTINFNDAGDGDATYNTTNDTFYVAVDDQDGTAGDSLYAWTNLGGTATFTEIGEIGLSQLIGLAWNPVDGMLYGYDSGNEALYTIDAGTGAATLVGASGVSLGAIGGMDFAPDGTLLLSAGDDLFLVDTSSGLLSAAGVLTGLNTSALSYRVPTPGAAALLGLAGVAAARRRR